MIAGICAGNKGLVQPGGNQGFRLIRRGTDAHSNALGRKEFLGPLSHPASDDHIDTLFPEPFWQHTRFVRRRDNIIACTDCF